MLKWVSQDIFMYCINLTAYQCIKSEIRLPNIPLKQSINLLKKILELNWVSLTNLWFITFFLSVFIFVSGSLQNAYLLPCCWYWICCMLSFRIFEDGFACAGHTLNSVKKANLGLYSFVCPIWPNIWSQQYLSNCVNNRLKTPHSTLTH